MTVREVLALPVMQSGRILAGAAGLDRVVERLNMMEVPDVLPWVRPRELLVTSGYPLRELTSSQIAALTRDLSGQGLSGLCIKLGRFLPEIPPNVIEAADDEAFPLLAMPVDLAFTDLLGAVLGELLDRQEAALRASDEIDRVLLQTLVAGGGHAEIAHRLGQWLGMATVIADEDGRIVAASELGVPDRLRVRGAPGRLQLRTLPRPGEDIVAVDGDVAVARVQAGTSIHGYLVTASEGAGVTAGQLLGLRRAAPVVALAFARANEIRAVEARYRGDFLRDLITGMRRPGDDPTRHAELLGWRLAGPLVVVVAEPPLTAAADRGAAYARLASSLSRAAEGRWPGAVVHGFAAEVVAVLPADSSQLDAWATDARAHLARSERGFLAGVSRRAEGVGELPLAYQQAAEALRSARQGSARAPIVSFDDLGLARLLSLVADTAEGERLVQDVVGPLLRERNGDVLLATLECFLETNCNVAETARLQHFHYNTIRLRVARLEELLGGFVDDAERRAELLTACRLRLMLDRRL